MKRRVLSIDGGGLRGVVALGQLARLEALLRARYGPQFTLADYFDLVGGTSTGAIIATGIALGRDVERITQDYLDRAHRVFRPTRDPTRMMGLRPRFDSAALEAEFQADLGAMTLGDPALRTRLAIIAKRVDTGAPWILTNIQSASYFDDPNDGSYVGNRHYLLSRLLMASTAAPTLFDPVKLKVEQQEPQGVFVDGGMSPHNNPAIAMLMVACMAAFGLSWPTGADQLSIVSVGTGALRSRISKERSRRALPLSMAMRSLASILTDTMTQNEVLLAWLGEPLLPRPINSEIGDLAAENLAPEPLFRYLRLNVPLEATGLDAYGLAYSAAELRKMRAISDPEVMDALHDLSTTVAARDLSAELIDLL